MAKIKDNLEYSRLERQDDLSEEHELHEVYEPRCSTCYGLHKDCQWCSKSIGGQIGVCWENDGEGGEGNYRPCSNN